MGPYLQYDTLVLNLHFSFEEVNTLARASEEVPSETHSSWGDLPTVCLYVRSKPSRVNRPGGRFNELQLLTQGIYTPIKEVFPTAPLPTSTNLRIPTRCQIYT